MLLIFTEQYYRLNGKMQQSTFFQSIYPLRQRFFQRSACVRPVLSVEKYLETELKALGQKLK